MTDEPRPVGLPSRRWPRRRWLRGVRARLVVTYLAAASVLAVAGTILFTVILRLGLQDNIDAGLQTRADAIATDVAAGNVEHGNPAPTVGKPSRATEDLTAFTAVIDPTGRLVEAQPSRLPASLAIAHPTSAQQFRSAQFDGSPYRILTLPVRRSGGIWLVVAGQNLEPARDTNAQIRRALTVVVPILLAMVGVGAWLLSGAALRPVDRMRSDAQRLSDTNARGRISEPGTRDGLDRLAKTFNQLLDGLHHSLDQQRALVADAGHELRTPLAVLRTELETAVRPNRTRDDLVDSIEHAQVEVARLADLAEDLLLLAQADSGRPIVVPELTEVRQILDAAVAAHQGRAAAKSISIDVLDSEPVLADVDPSALRRIIDNLLTNAVRHAPENGHIWLSTEIVGGPSGSSVRLSVRDDGPGFPADYLDHAFERFSRPDMARSRAESSSGTGLGLAVVRSLATAMGGTASASNHPQGGAVVQIELPLRSD
jgi:two-component system, OmpR family, sensor kinase